MDTHPDEPSPGSRKQRFTRRTMIRAARSPSPSPLFARPISLHMQLSEEPK
jgi:hypothetical protein